MRILMRLCETKSHEISWPSLMRLPVEIALNHPKLCLGTCADAQNVLGALNGLLALFRGLCIVLLSSVFSGGAMWGRSTISYDTLFCFASLLSLRRDWLDWANQLVRNKKAGTRRQTKEKEKSFLGRISSHSPSRGIINSVRTPS